MAVEFVLDAKDRKRIEKMLSEESAQRIGKVLFRAFQQAGAQIEGRLKDNVRGPILRVRSSRLINSIGSTAVVRGNQVIATIGSGVGAGKGDPVPYAEIHETGGTVKPKNKKWLTIPIGNARTLGGDKKGGMTAFNLFRGAVSGYDGAYVPQWKVGGIIFGIISGQKNKLMPLFILAKTVQMPKRRYVSRTLEQSEKEIPNMVIEAVARELRSINDGR